MSTIASLVNAAAVTLVVLAALTAAYKSASILLATATNNCCPICSTGLPCPDNTASSVIEIPLATFLTVTFTIDSVMFSKVNVAPSPKSAASPM